MKWKIFISFIAIIFIDLLILSIQSKMIVIHLGIFVDNWGVPNGDSYKIIDNAIARFEQEYPNIQIEYESGILKEDYSTWLDNKILQGEEPDVFMVIDEDFNTLSSLGILENLGERIKADRDFNLDNYYESAIKSGQYQGIQYALPYESNPTMMFVNKTLLTKEGIEIPDNNWTLDDFYNICQKVTKDTNNDGSIDQYGCYNFRWLDSIYSHGINLFDEKGKLCAIDQQEAKDAISFVKKLNKLNQEHNITAEEFDAGKVAFTPMSFAQYRTYKPYPWKVKKYSNFEWDCIKMPAVIGNRKTGELSTLLMGISSRSKHQDIAWEFLKVLTYEKETQKEIGRYSQGVSSLKTGLYLNETIMNSTQNIDESNINQELLNQVMTDTIEQGRFKKYNSALNLLDIRIQSIIKNEEDLDMALLNLKKEINKYLKE